MPEMASSWYLTMKQKKKIKKKKKERKNEKKKNLQTIKFGL